jgi:hypothetical protein
MRVVGLIVALCAAACGDDHECTDVTVVVPTHRPILVDGGVPDAVPGDDTKGEP